MKVAIHKVVPVLLALACVSSATAAEFNAVSSKDAIKAMVAAGYSGVGGVTRNDPYYFAAAISPEGKRVRVAVDVRTGEVVKVTALPRGAGSVTPPESLPSTLQSYDPPRIVAPTVEGGDYYQPIGPRRRIGVRYYPWNSNNQPARGWCKYQAAAPGC
jgi:hypothetical protein